MADPVNKILATQLAEIIATDGLEKEKSRDESAGTCLFRVRILLYNAKTKEETQIGGTPVGRSFGPEEGSVTNIGLNLWQEDATYFHKSS